VANEEIEELASPFGEDPIEEVHLERAPLAKVLAQVRFPGLAILKDDSIVSTFASQLGKEYPVLQEQRGVNLLVTPTGVTQQQSNQRMWSLPSRDELWKITVSENFLTLDTVKYPSRHEFVRKFDQAAQKFIELVDPPYFERLGIRYINRVDDKELIHDRLISMIRREMIGALAIDRPENVKISHSVSDSLFTDGEYSIQMRCGALPPGAVLDIDITPIQEPMWILDIDSYIEQKMYRTPEELASKLNILAERAYRMFRWVVNAEFIRHFGGQYEH
jgi:uncharacterized protein (TIGR04255 family)